MAPNKQKPQEEQQQPEPTPEPAPEAPAASEGTLAPPYATMPYIPPVGPSGNVRLYPPDPPVQPERGPARDDENSIRPLAERHLAERLFVGIIQGDRGRAVPNFDNESAYSTAANKAFAMAAAFKKVERAVTSSQPQ